MYISFKAWSETCKKMLLSVLWYRCLELAIYTDLFTLKETLVGNEKRTPLDNYFPSNIFFLFKVSYKNNEIRGEIYSMLIIKTSERRHDVVLLFMLLTLNIFLVFLLLTLNKKMLSRFWYWYLKIIYQAFCRRYLLVILCKC